MPKFSITCRFSSSHHLGALSVFGTETPDSVTTIESRVTIHLFPLPWPLVTQSRWSTTMPTCWTSFNAALSSSDWEIVCLPDADVAKAKILEQRFSALLTDALPGYESLMSGSPVSLAIRYGVAGPSRSICPRSYKLNHSATDANNSSEAAVQSRSNTCGACQEATSR